MDEPQDNFELMDDDTAEIDYLHQDESPSHTDYETQAMFESSY